MLRFEVDDLARAEVRALLEAHAAHCRGNSPPESCHMLDLSGLKAPEITVWTVWDGSALVGIGALKQIDASNGELKSMHVPAAARGKGYAGALLTHLISQARERGLEALFLETGSMEAFAAARALYARHGFEECPPFGDYVLDPLSRYMTRPI
ncbi:putative acetyltransferase [Rubricella aquisinus]|uniref:Putative acetyltransferase n=1 Tax=Rubricella aquisinus TaxID=2028108 RepID=A0A840X605_9RHOB|nr:GNAT family N-acetyltransferase [Rubricella aquisinus]MBB5517206.1 putative acetyltransferase [Rubricella aquisinus]